MTKHQTGTREAWLTARLQLLQAEKELTRRSDELARRRQELPWVRIDKEYVFDTDAGEQSLRDLFAGRSQLLVYQFMFGPTLERRMRYLHAACGKFRPRYHQPAKRCPPVLIRRSPDRAAEPPSPGH